MASCKLFNNDSWRLPLPAPFDDPSVDQKSSAVISKYNTASGRARQSTLHAPTLKALLKYGELVTADEAGTAGPEHGAVGHQNNNYLVAEYPANATETCCVVYNKNSGKFYAGTFAGPGALSTAYSLGTSGGHTGAALFFTLLHEMPQDAEFSDAFADFRDEQKTGFTDLAKAANVAYMLCDNIYRRIENHASLKDDGVKVSIPASMNIAQFTDAALARNTYSPTAVVYGNFNIINVGAAPKTAAASIDHSSFVGQYQMSTRNFSSKELSLIPQLPDWYIIPEEARLACEHISKTTGTNSPIRTIMLRGPAGTGKTMCSRAIAAGLGRPYMFYTCSANTETVDIMGQILPETEYARQFGSAIDMELPTVQDIVMDPSTAYFNMTGEYDENITEQEVLDTMIEIAAARKSEKSESSGQKFYFVETSLVTALREGYVIELQEPTVIANPGVLSCLNSLMDDSKAVMLPTGQRLERHPESVVIVTTNVNYNGCRDLNQAFISRMNLMMDMDEPDTTTMAKRVMKITGCTDEKIVREMAEVVKDIQLHCKELMITDGSCGVRELLGWVQSFMITADAYRAALYTVIAAASSDIDNRTEIINTCLEPKFSAS